MVKFSKQFEAQLVPEWKDAFVDYCKLKKDLKKIQNLATGEDHLIRKHPPNASPLQALVKLFPSCGHGHKDHEIIQVHKKLASSPSNDMYETELLEQFADTDATKEFFARLDQQLNKVNQFYNTKENEFVERGESLKKQMNILIHLKSALKNNDANGSSSSTDYNATISIASEEDSVKIPIDEEDTDPPLQSCRNCKLERSQSQCAGYYEGESGGLVKVRQEETWKLRSLSLNGRTITCQGKNVKMNIPLTTPSRTLSALTNFLWEDFVDQSNKCGPDASRPNINKTKLHTAEKMIRGAFIELYKGLGYLSTYRNLNLMAFAKILKKFDKVTGKQVLAIYLKVVESSYFNSSVKVIKLADEVEELFVKHFAEDDRRKAMKYLKPNQCKESHGVTFFIGLFTGCFTALFIGYCVMAHIAGMYTMHSDTIYMETVYPVLSMFSLLFLHLFLYGCNIFFWRKSRINYVFIFEFSPTKELKYREVFLVCATSMSIVIGVLVSHISLIAKGHTSTQIQTIPGLLFLFFLALLFCPFNFLYRSSRFYFLKIVRNIVLSPLYKVVMVDFFMADQLCSQVTLLRNMEYVGCYYITGSYKTQDYVFCNTTTLYKDLSYAVSFLPYYWRAMQCARRWFDEGETSHLINLGKYVSAMLAAGAKVAYEKQKGIGYLALVVIISSAATVYQLYWDFVKDWGLLQFNSKNPWLRNELMLRRKFIYYISMGVNLVLRLAWLQTLLHSNFGDVDYRVMTFFLAALEVIRRGLWNFYRLENEHLNNAGKFRAVKTVPLPFHEVDED